METLNQTLVYPGPKNLQILSKKWHVSTNQIHEAIMQTGSLEPETIKNYLRKDSLIHHPVTGLKVVLRNTLNFIF